LRKIWKECPCCNQRYQKELRVDLATAFVSYVEGQHPDDQGMLVTALNEKLMSLERMAKKNRCTPQTRQEARDTANKMLSTFEQMKNEEDPLPNRVQHIEPKVYGCLGRIALEEGTKDSLKEALSHYEKSRDLCLVLGLTNEVALAEYNISVAKEECEGVSSMSIEKKVEQLQEVYDMRLKKHGEGSTSTLNAGLCLTRDLIKADRLVEAESLLLYLATVSKQVHGSDHSMTEKIHSEQRRLSRKCKSHSDKQQGNV